jgi:DNA-binding NtrC family response regulator
MAPGSDLGLEHLPDEIRGDLDGGRPSKRGIQPLMAAEREFERGYLLRTLDETDWNRTRAAELLGISRKTLWKKLRELGIDQATDAQ